MTPAQDAQRGRQAKEALEFLEPAFKEIRAQYADRIKEIAVKELNGKKRTDKITCLSTALRVTEEVEGIIRAIVLHGEVAAKDIERMKKVEDMTPAQRRLLNIGR